MEENTLSYSEVLNYFGETKITDRYKFLYDKMQEYIHVRGLEDKLYIQENILQQVVMDYFTDIYRLKEFHKLSRANITKIVSYESYWILRRKPLQVMQGEQEYKLVFANEGFVTTFLAHEFLIPKESEPMTKEEEEQFLAYLRHLNYHLKYRNIDKQDLEAMLFAYQTGRMLG
jgi:hypothetical protein